MKIETGKVGKCSLCEIKMRNHGERIKLMRMDLPMKQNQACLDQWALCAKSFMRSDEKGNRLFALCKLFALLGGLLFLALLAMSIVSIVGRKLFSAPVVGDIELMQMGTAVASAALLGYCEMTGKHLRVDFYTNHKNKQKKTKHKKNTQQKQTKNAIVIA